MLCTVVGVGMLFIISSNQLKIIKIKFVATAQWNDEVADVKIVIHFYCSMEFF